MSWFWRKSEEQAAPASAAERTDKADASPRSERLERLPEQDPVLEDLRARVESAGLPAHARSAARDECERLAKVDRSSPEYALSCNYLEFLLSLPWNVSTKDDLDLERASALLDARHFGLGRVKERILEFLAVKSLRSRRQARILLADDEAIARENLTIVFEKDGHEVRAVSNGLEALEAMREQPADVVVTDLKMERMDGLELLQELRKGWPDTGVIMLTGYATVKSAVTAMRQGADQYLSKPVNLTKLRAHVDELLLRSGRARFLRGPVLCFSGPPGTGKTSIGKAIAEALGRKFFRLSLAGLRDEAELRGHRRTYVGSMPGRILQGVVKAGARNPVIMLDEMDKVVQDFQGDAASVLLEILDPEQNAAFGDHYLGLPFDLSGAMFIATANVVERLPGPLRDRMEVIEFTSYTPDEKAEIAVRHLVPEQLRQHGLEPGEVRFEPEAVRKIVADYTREAGLRGLERQVASLCRKLARQVLEKNPGPEGISVSAEDVERLLGPSPHFRASARTKPRVGLAAGLAWTENGGEIILVEAARMPGNQQLMLTGSLGEVLRESARTGLSYIRSCAAQYGIPADFYESSDIHVHIPAGAVSKEGPSAGVTITLALLSLLTGRPVRPDVAVSGELSLLGEVLPVGGVREKLMAAVQAGFATVLLPAGCAGAVEGVEPEVLAALDVKLVESMEQAAELALLPETERVASAEVS
ncbi:S16 family serine protease [Paucidesulfovibrio longus]|uniref:S16 family serine protease n=1 Tax=Paucidesulfovibrio longus TaxID=889 RepID=UPI0003B60063|nr:S16 family serine protease [Paucidesulfovibrio longus]